MTQKVFLLILFFSGIFTTSFSQDKFNAQEYVDNIFTEYPSIACDLINHTIVKQKFVPIKKTQRSDYFYSISRSLITVKDKELTLYDKPVVYLPPKQLPLGNYYKRNSKTARMIYKWEFDIPTKDQYLIIQPSFANAQGFFNQQPLLNLGHGILSYQFSGNKFFTLNAGPSKLELIKLVGKNIKLYILSKKSYTEIKKNVVQHMSSTDEKDVQWILKKILPHLGSKRNGVAPLINRLLRTQPYLSYTKKHPKETVELIKSYIKSMGSAYEAYLLAKQFYQYHPALFISEIMVKNDTVIGRRPFNQIFLRQGIPDNNNKTIFEVIEKMIAYQKKKMPDKKQVEYAINLYKSLIKTYIHFGQAEGHALANRKIQALIMAGNKRGLAIKKHDFIPDQRASNLIISESTKESLALNTQRTILDYKDEETILEKCYNQLLGMKHFLIKKNDHFYSIRHIFIDAAQNNQAFLNDFKKYSLKKLSGKIKKHLLKKDIQGLKNIAAQFSMILKLPEVHQALGEYYFKRGFFEKAYFHLSWTAKINPGLKPVVLSKLYALEDLCDLLPQNRTPLNSFKNNQIKFKGKQISLAKLKTTLKNNTIFKPLAPGRLIKRIPLPNDHIQYWNHPVKLTHQGVEPLFTASKLFLSTSNSILAFNLTDGKLLWKDIGSNEYYRSTERGPHQKRFVLEQSGSKIYQFANMNYSGRKTIKSFSINGDFNWDLYTLKGMRQKEPLSAPIANGGNLAFLSYDSKQTLPSIAFNIIDPTDGFIHTSIPLGAIRNKRWNSYRHDQHFIKEEQFIYGFTGTGMIFKADTVAKQLLWGQSYITNLPQNYYHKDFHKTYAHAPSGYIRAFGETIVSYMPDIQILTGTNKSSGKNIWRSDHLRPMLFHGRKSKHYIYFSEHTAYQTPKLVKVNANTGETIWRKSTNGLIPQGEGELTEKHIIIPCLKSLAFFDKKNGQFIKKISLTIQPLKIVYGHNRWVILTKKDAFLLNNSGILKPTQLLRSPFQQTGFVKPDAMNPPLPYDSLCLEKSIYIPEKAYTSGAYDASLISTSMPQHHILKRGHHITLFREGFEQKSGAYIQPSILWYSQIPYHCLLKDKIIISEPGEVRAEDLFTRKILWQYQYQTELPITWGSPSKRTLVVTSNSQFIIFQTPSGTIRVLDSKTRKHLFDMIKENAKSMVVIGSKLIINHGAWLKAYDINLRGKFLWKKKDRHSFSIYSENGHLVIVARTLGTLYADPTTGKQIYKFFPPRRHSAGQTNRVLGKKFSLAYNSLFETKTGKLVTKYKEARAVKNGGYLCFPTIGSSSGEYLEGGKVYTIQFRVRGDNRNPQFTSFKKGNKIIVFSIYSIETFEIKEKTLELIDFVSIEAAHFGHRDDTSLFPLDNSLLELRGTQMYFLRQFDPHNHFSKIKSFRVSNKVNSDFPYNELYPETKIENNQWLSNNRSKPSRKVHYQIFANQQKAFLHFRLSPQVNLKEKTMLRISANQQSQPVIIKWSPDLWEHCIAGDHINDSLKSWKEKDDNGDLHLYIVVPLKTFYSRFRNTLPDFAIEFRQFQEGIELGTYRIGGSFYNKNRTSRYGSMKLLEWDTYVNDEAQTLDNFKLRSNLYSSGKGFFPQGLELQKWVIDARRFHSQKENISMVKALAKKNAHSFCVINILAVLLKEKLHLFKIKNPEILDIHPSFYKKIVLSLNEVYAFAKSIGVKPDWIKFALTFHTLEVFPSKEISHYRYGPHHKAIHGYHIAGYKRNIISTYYKNVDDPSIQDVNKPHLTFLLTSLFSGYPSEKSVTKMGLSGVQTKNTCLGQLTRFGPGSKKILWSRDFQKIDPVMIIKEKKPLDTKARTYNFDKKTFKCFSLKAKKPVDNIGFITPAITIPTVKEDVGLKYENIIRSLKSLPSNSQIGPIMISTITAQNSHMKLDDLLKLYEMWLLRINQNEKAFFNAMNYIHRYLGRKKYSNINLYKKLFKAAKIPTRFQRIFILKNYNKLGSHSKWSYLGPFKGKLIEKPYVKFDKTKKYSNGKTSFQFGKFARGESSNFYIAINLKTKKKTRAFLYILNPERNSGSISYSWLNNKPSIKGIYFNQVRHQLITKKMVLKKGSNLLILKLEDIQRIRYCGLAIGDKNGFPIKGIETDGPK
ncbi:MAG: hypothetical protein COA79_07250 [Planctomycetota bacterium]|nr:MAG: hypothetical protein COA79_07250 [Planctomycetota bacterium]